jgi:hypothetical protein
MYAHVKAQSRSLKILPTGELHSRHDLRLRLGPTIALWRAHHQTRDSPVGFTARGRNPLSIWSRPDAIATVRTDR